MSVVRCRWLLTAGALVLPTLVACDSARRQEAERREPARPVVASAGAAPLGSDHGADGHDCADHAPEPRPTVPTATKLSDETRGKVTALRIFAHTGAVILRKGATGWTGAGCTVSQGRVELALDNLSQLTARPSDDRPAPGSVFDLQIMAESDNLRVLHLNVADRSDGEDLIQLLDQSVFRVTGLDRELLAPDPKRWCAHD
jgi:hypothetical protein